MQEMDAAVVEHGSSSLSKSGCRVKSKVQGEKKEENHKTEFVLQLETTRTKKTSFSAHVRTEILS